MEVTSRHITHKTSRELAYWITRKREETGRMNFRSKTPGYVTLVAEKFLKSLH